MNKLITLNVNGVNHQVAVKPQDTLIKVLREDLNLTGAKEGCGMGECGACAVLVEGKVINACLVLALDMQDANIATIEGLANGELLHPIQQSFIDHGAIHCGFCTPGLIMTAKDLLDHNPRPTVEEIKKAIAGNVCRCTGYTKIVEAIKDAADRI